MTGYILESVNGDIIPEELEEEVKILDEELNRKYCGCQDNSYYKELIEYDIALFNKQVEENHPHLNFKLRIKSETPETSTIKTRLDGLQSLLLDMIDDVNDLQQDIQFIYRNIEKLYEGIEEEE